MPVPPQKIVQTLCTFHALTNPNFRLFRPSQMFLALQIPLYWSTLVEQKETLLTPPFFILNLPPLSPFPRGVLTPACCPFFSNASDASSVVQAPLKIFFQFHDQTCLFPLPMSRSLYPGLAVTNRFTLEDFFIHPPGFFPLPPNLIEDISFCLLFSMPSSFSPFYLSI